MFIPIVSEQSQLRWIVSSSDSLQQQKYILLRPSFKVPLIKQLECDGGTLSCLRRLWCAALNETDERNPPLCCALQGECVNPQTERRGGGQKKKIGHFHIYSSVRSRAVWREKQSVRDRGREEEEGGLQPQELWGFTQAFLSLSSLFVKNSRTLVHRHTQEEHTRKGRQENGGVGEGRKRKRKFPMRLRRERQEGKTRTRRSIHTGETKYASSKGEHAGERAARAINKARWQGLNRQSI